jgi:hypothetical protein
VESIKLIKIKIQNHKTATSNQEDKHSNLLLTISNSNYQEDKHKHLLPTMKNSPNKHLELIHYQGEPKLTYMPIEKKLS